MKRFLSAFMASIMLMLVITGSAAMAATNEVQQESTFELSRELIDKADPFVKLQSQKFTLSEDASQNLTVDEVELVNKALNLANEQAKNIPGNDVTVTETSHNSLKVAPSTFSTAAINTSSYWDYELLGGDIAFFYLTI